MMRRFTRSQIEEIYRTHPQRGEAILRRIQARRGSTAAVTVLDLAEDADGGITDQNHMGGLAFTRQLAQRVGISQSAHVLDLGCGLGGTARALAWWYGCHVHGIDLSQDRIADARHLTELVGLTRLATFECADVMTASLPEDRFDVLWGQAAWSHLPDKAALLRKWTAVLEPGGRVALEDVCLLRAPAGDTERGLLRALEDHWTSYLIPLEGPGGWQSVMLQSGFATQAVDDCSEGFLAHFLELRAGAGRQGEPVSAFERQAWNLAIDAINASLVGYFRLVARRSPSPVPSPAASC
jgi:SAM-dependent methyltransferase